MRRGGALRAYLGATYALSPLARPLLTRRLAKGKEDPQRWREKLGQRLAPRPQGRLIWLHGVGLGEVMSLRGLIGALGNLAPDLQFLVTSSTHTSAMVFAKHQPPRCLHQFLPLDLPGARRRFLDHFQPDFCLWAEQDLWPGFVSDMDRRGIPQAVIAARMTADGRRNRARAGRFFADLYSAMALIAAQDAATAQHLESLGAAARVTGSLKPACPALSCDRDTLARLQEATAQRFVWAVAPAHPADVAIAEAAHAALRQTEPEALLIIAPRFVDQWQDHPAPRWSQGQLPNAYDPIWLCDTFGDLGLVYQIAEAVLIGGTFDATEGHNPWEAAGLSTAILHGPRIAHFQPDFAQLMAAGAAIPVADAPAVCAALRAKTLAATARRARDSVAAASATTKDLAQTLLQLLDGADAG